MAELVVGPVMEKIINSCSDYLVEQVGWQTGFKELERLRENQPKIQAVVFAANRAQISDQNPDLKDPAFNKWIWQLRDAIDEADDVLDEFEYMKHKEQLPKNPEETKKRKFTSFLFESPRKILKIGERVLKRDPTLKRLEEAVQKLDKVSADVTNFFYLLDSAKQEQKEQDIDFYKTRETGYLPKNDLIGRGKDKELVMEWLRNPSNEHRGTDLYRNISLLSVVGHGGMGKTTLLQHVYKDEMTKEFDLKMWVCVSNNFDVKKVIADMLECLENERPRLETLVALQRRLEEEVKSKKFLLVLDDIWEEEEERDQSKWENVLAALASGSFGSKILVTTRTDSVALMFAKVIKKEEEIVKLEGLEEDECLQLLNSHAFAGVENPSDDHKKLRAIAGEIVKKLLGSPLAAKVIGGVLKDNLNERHWRTILESNLLGHNSINFILRLSYIILPNPLKSCFAFCGMFAQDHIFDKDDLIRMWIALGFIQPSLDQEETMEDIGGRYFDVLVKKSFFDKFVDEDFYFFQYYKMHDLLHKLAQSVFIQEYLRVEDITKLPSKISETIRHLSVQTTNLNILRKIEKFKHLHSLFLFYEGSDQDLRDALMEIFKVSRCLRLLYIHNYKLEMIPAEIGNLIHLRYLKISGFEFTRLPRSLSNLYHLQYLIYDGYVSSPPEVDFLPSNINNLSNLHYLKLPLDYISLSICGIGKLKSLQELNMFDLKDVSGYRIGELENMNDLCKLGINCLENVKDAEEVCSAKLYEKRRLTNLTLRWSCSRTDSKNTDLYENLLDNLQPPKCLMDLCIIRYMGARSAIWMNNVNPIFNLEKIELTECLEWETLPPFGQLPFLKSLELQNMPKVKWLESKFNGNDKYHAFPLLEVLHIERLEALEDWFEAGVAVEDGCLFPCLTELFLNKCPKLKELPSLPSKLKSLSIRSTAWKTLNFCSNSNPIPLESLAVVHRPNITSLPLADEIARLAALRNLKIESCSNLISLGRHREMHITNYCHLILEKIELTGLSEWETLPPFGQLPLLKSLELRNMPKVKWLESKFNGNDKYRAFPLLEELRIYKLEALEDWFEAGVAAEDGCLFPCLIQLHLFKCPKLKELPSLPSKLKSLSIRSTAWKTLNFCSNSNPIPLESLAVVHRPNITSLPLADEIARLAALRNLKIESCSNLISLGRHREMHITNYCHLILEKIELTGLSEWETLPPFGQLPLLKSLELRNMPKVKWLESKFNGNDKYRAFPLLEELRIYKLEALEDWFEAGVAAEDGCLFPCLIQLHLFKCPKLKELPSLPSKLKSLSLRSTAWKTLNFCSNSNPIPLESLAVVHRPNITSLPLADEIARLAALGNLTIERCPNLISLGRHREMQITNNCHLILERIELTGLSEWETLPTFGQLPFLKSLRLDNMPKVKWLESKFNGNDIYRAFPLLEKLYIKRLEALEDWFEAGVAAEDGCLFPCLIQLELHNCPKLKELPSLPPKLNSLLMENTAWKTLNFCSSSNPIPLQRLEVSYCPNITSLYVADEIARLAALRCMKIIECPNLVPHGEIQTTNNCHLMLNELSISDPLVLLMEPLRSIASLQKLIISCNDEVVSFPNEAGQWFLKVSSSLCDLEFSHFKSLQSLPSTLESLSSLQYLRITGVPMLRELPNLPPSLKHLSIAECHPELKERYREDGGNIERNK